MSTPESPRLSFVDHLEELRLRIIICVIAVGVCCILTYALMPYILPYVLRHAGKVHVFQVQEAFMTKIKIAMYGGIFLAAPVVLFEIWKFVAVGLKKNERKYLFIFGPGSLIMFAVGACFALFAVVPLCVRFFKGAGQGITETTWGFGYYVSFLGTLMLGCGIMFNMPLALLLLGKLGLVTPEFLRNKRRHAIVIIFIVTAIVTPTWDIFTELAVALPIILLYELSIILVKIFK